MRASPASRGRRAGADPRQWRGPSRATCPPCRQEEEQAVVRHLAELWARRKDSSREATGYAARDRKFGNVQAVSCGHDHTAGHRAREHRGLEGERGCGEGQSHFAIRSAADLQPFIHLPQTLFSTVKCTEDLSKTRECSRRSQDVLCLLDQCLRHASFPSFINGVRKFVHSSSELRLVEILGAESLHHLFDCP